MAALANIVVPPAMASWRRVPLDDALLLFDRDTGWNALCDGPETVGLRQQAPRVVQFSITNACNLACTFCSRDRDAESAWTVDTAFALLRDLAGHGVLEVAFGGGEPLAFRGYEELCRRLRNETPLAVHATTNGRLLDAQRLERLSGTHGQWRLSVYDDVDWRLLVQRLVGSGQRFGLNYLVTPARLPDLETTVVEFAAHGCRDVLLLRYKGHDASLHLPMADAVVLGERIASLARATRSHLDIKLDVCFGEWLAAAPRLFARTDCGAGRDFVVVNSDRNLSPCSFHDTKLPIGTAADVLHHWRHGFAVRPAANVPGCARLQNHGLVP